MKNLSIVKESLAGLLMLVLLFLFLNPLAWPISTDLFNMFAVALLVVFFLFAFLICHRKSNDERDEYVLLLGERFGFITGCSILLIALIIQARAGELDDWLVLTFIIMVIAKIIGMIYAKLRY
jgi:hypothetical protein